MAQRRLAYRPPLAAGRMLEFLGARTIDGVEFVNGSSYTRAVRTRDGSTVVIELAPRPVEPIVDLRIEGLGDESFLHDVVSMARRVLDLDADPGPIDDALGADVALRPSVTTRPGTRVPGATDGFELAVRAIVGQQVSVAGARTTLGRIAERFGESLPTAAGPIVRCFPTAERLAEAPRDAFGMPRVRTEAIGGLAGAVASGELDLSGGAALEPTLERLRAIRGVGGWTATYVAMRALRDPDAFPAGDLGVRRAFGTLGLPDDLRSIRLRAESWRPWRAYATMHLWDLPA